MKPDIRGGILALGGVLLFGSGVLTLLDLGYYGNFPVLRSLPRPGLLAPNLVFGGYALIEVGRYIATAGGTRDSRLFGDRLSVLTGSAPSTSESTPTTATGLWLWMFLLGLTGQIVWAALQFTAVAGMFQVQVIRYGSLLLMAVAVHYDMEHIAAVADWGGRRRWEIGVLIFPLNLVIAAIYLWLRRRKIQAADEDRGAPEMSGPSAREAFNHQEHAGGEHTAGRRWSWHYLILLCLIGWVIVLASPAVSIGSGGVGSLVAIAVSVLLPVATYLDSRTIVSELWDLRRTYWVLATIVPIVNIVVGSAYLLRRYETMRAMQLERRQLT